MNEFEWDVANISHIARHEVTPAEVEEVFYGRNVIVHDGIKDGEVRFRAHGVTARGRYLTVSYTERNERVRPITAFSMSRKDKKKYAEQIHEQE